MPEPGSTHVRRDGLALSRNVHVVGASRDIGTEEYLLKEWGHSLLSAGWAPASARRATNRLRAYSRLTRAGLLYASRDDVVAFAQARGKTMKKDLMGLIRTEGWRQDIRTIRAFYRWSKKKFLGIAGDPTVGIRQVPGHPPGVRIRSSDARLYESVLNATGLGDRDRLILLLLSHGLEPHEVARLRIEDVVQGRHLLLGRGTSRRTLALSDRAILGLATWLPFRGVHSPYLFPSSEPGKPISASAVRAVVRRATQRAFPRPDQERLRSRVHPRGFKELFLLRAVRARVALPYARLITGVDKLRRFERFGVHVEAHREFARVSRRWPKWI
jgi:integrase